MKELSLALISFKPGEAPLYSLVAGAMGSLLAVVEGCHEVPEQTIRDWFANNQELVVEMLLPLDEQFAIIHAPFN